MSFIFINLDCARLAFALVCVGPLQNRYSHENRLNAIFAKSFKIWCGGGDLNPYGIAPASTSS
jgi:hypothetical protein